MPNKYPESKGYKIPKQKHLVRNWTEYNRALADRGRIDIWMHDDAINNWYEEDTENVGDGSPRIYSDFAIMVCHEIRLVYKQPLRKITGFINSLFKMAGLKLRCPDFSTLSKRLKVLKIKSPRYVKKNAPDTDVHSLSIDSTGLKRFGRDEWHQEKHKVSAKRSWRKLHVAVDQNHYIHSSILTGRFDSDIGTLPNLLGGIDGEFNHVSMDGAYDSFDVYEQILDKFGDIEIAIPPDKDAVICDKNHIVRNHNIEHIKCHGRMDWQRKSGYGRRNYSELAIQRYKRIIGRSLHSRDFKNQKIESIIGAGVLNKMTSLGMPDSYRIA